MRNPAPNPISQPPPAKSRNAVAASSRRRCSEVGERVYVKGRDRSRAGSLPVLLLADAGQHGQRAAQLALDAELDVGVEAVADHARARAVELELALDGVEHRLAGLAEREGRLARHVGEGGRGDGARAGVKIIVHGQGGVQVGREEDGAAPQVVERVRELEVVDVEVEARQDDADLVVQQRAVGEPREVLGRDVPAQVGVRAADERDVLGLELALDAGLAEHEDLVLAGREPEDARDVDGRRVRRAENLLDVAGDPQPRELLLVLLPGLGRVVGDKDDSLACRLLLPWSALPTERAGEVTRYSSMPGADLWILEALVFPRCPQRDDRPTRARL